MGPFYMYSYGVRNNASPMASADVALSCKSVRPVTRGGHDRSFTPNGQPFSTHTMSETKLSILRKSRDYFSGKILKIA